MCEGFSLDDVIALDAAHIAEHGVAMQAVVGPGGENDGLGSWLYTVGLLDAAAHPELIIAGVSPNSSAPVLSVLARAVLDGERFEVDETIDLGGAIAVVGSVHKIHYELDTFNTWHRLKSAGVLRAHELVAAQIILPPELLPSARRRAQPLLADRDARVDVTN
jgi:hypothetical protein